MPAFRRKNSHDSDIADFCQAIEKQPLTNAQEVEIECQATTDLQDFPHGLRRPYRGIIVTAQSEPVTVYPAMPTYSPNSSRFFSIALGAATACTLRVVVY